MGEEVLVLDDRGHDVCAEDQPEHRHADDVEHRDEASWCGARVEIPVADGEAGHSCPPLALEPALVLDDAERQPTDDVVDDEQHEHGARAIHHATHDADTTSDHVDHPLIWIRTICT